MYARRRRYWAIAIQSLGVLILTAALVSVVGLAGASASAPMSGARTSAVGGPPGGGGNGSGGTPMPSVPPLPPMPTKPSVPPMPGGHQHCRCYFPYFQPIYFPIAVPVYQQFVTVPTYSFATAYIPPPAYSSPSVYTASATYTATPATATYTAQQLSSFGAGWNTGLSQAAIAAVCHQYSVALQYGTMTDNPALDQICGPMNGATTTTPSSTTPSGSGGSYSTPYP
jgi:hypothetical protein